MFSLWNLTLLAGLLTFAVSLYQGRSFGAALRMGVGILIIGGAATLLLSLIGPLFALMGGLLTVAFWVLIVFALFRIAGSALRTNI